MEPVPGFAKSLDINSRCKFRYKEVKCMPWLIVSAIGLFVEGAVAGSSLKNALK